jgi:5-dehydro-4-deoxyglucarate dehydratase
MSKMTPQEMAEQIGGGLLSFPVTPFKPDYSFDEATYRANMDWLCGYEVAGLFAAGGTGEFFSLTPAEVPHVVGIAVDETKGRVPVLAGTGYGTAIAREIAAGAEKAGADGLLLLPPYLTHSEQDGLAAHVEAVCASVKIGVIVYNRDNAVLNEDTLAGLCDRNANLVGFKDGVGDLELLARVHARLGKRVTYVGGMPTAETYALPYHDLGFDTYSSAIFNFMPVWAQRFFGAVRGGDRATVQHHLQDFVMPYITIRNRAKGYAVSIVKAGCRVVGRPAGNVRSPLTELKPAEVEELRQLIARAQKLN